MTKTINPQQTEVTISSLDIAKMTEKQHSHVMRDIKLMLEALGLGLSIFGASYLNSQNKEQPMYLLPKREALILASGYDVKLRASIIDRLEELEAKNTPEPLTRRELAMLVIESEDKILSLENKIDKDKPKVSYANAIIGTINPVSLREWINSLKSDQGLLVGEKKVISFLIAKKYIYRNAKGCLRAYAKEDPQYFSLIPVTVATPQGNKEYFQLKITGQGQLSLAEKVIKHFNG